jgi:beta-galactosidase
MKSLFVQFWALLALMSLPVLAQQTTDIPDAGWRLWLDKEAAWENDTIYLPADAGLSKLPAKQPTGGWTLLNSTTGISVTLPSTVEEHYWGTNGYRKYQDEYFYETQDTIAKNGNYLGVSWWWKGIDIPKSFAGKQVILFIRGARLRAEVYLNRQLIGYNIITETSFSCDASSAIKPGEKNLLAIRITNPGGRLDWLDTQLMPWGKTNQSFHRSHGFGGLDRGIKISAHDKIYFTDLWALNTLQPNKLQIHATIINKIGTIINAVLRIELIDPDSSGKVCLKQEKNITLEESSFSITTDITYPGALLWNLNTPKLYRLRATIFPAAAVKKNSWKDTREVTTGFRWFEADSIGSNAVLRFNGNRIRITSAISWGFWGINGLWPTAERSV